VKNRKKKRKRKLLWKESQIKKILKKRVKSLQLHKEEKNKNRKRNQTKRKMISKRLIT
jgi:hypothetical protein